MCLKDWIASIQPPPNILEQPHAALPAPPKAVQACVGNTTCTLTRLMMSVSCALLLCASSFTASFIWVAKAFSTPRVQYTAVTTSTTWPGHWSTH
eukprot:1160559-Pelagomonas_calceolata.AAC.13